MIKPVIAMQSCDQRWILAMTNPPKNRLWLKTRPLKLKIAKCLCKNSLKFENEDFTANNFIPLFIVKRCSIIFKNSFL